MRKAAEVSRDQSSQTVSIGIPVYNGADYLAELLDCVAAQTYGDLEIVICDNASTDETGDICRQYAARDARIRYHRNETNIGPLPNFNKAFELSQGAYFCWLCHDDLIEPTYVEKCVSILKQDPSVVLAFSDVLYIGPDGTALPRSAKSGQYYCGDEHMTVPAFPAHVAEQRSRVGRFADLLLRTDGCYESGMVRRHQLAATSLQVDFYGGGEVWLMELAMHGRFVMLDEKLFRRRFHPNASFFVAAEDKDAWINQAQKEPTKQRKFRWTRAYLDVIRRSPTMTGVERLRCRLLVLDKTFRGIAHKTLAKGLARTSRRQIA